MCIRDRFQPLVIGTDIWKGFGYNTVVYLAAILGVDKSLYEAAAADGAGKFKRIWHCLLYTSSEQKNAMTQRKLSDFSRSVG